MLTLRELALHRSLTSIAKNIEEVRRFEALREFGWIRAVTVLLPWSIRHSDSRASRPCGVLGIGLERRHSGNGPVRTRMTRQGHRRIKDVLLGAAKSAITQGDKPVRRRHQIWKEEGLHTANARRNVARAIASTLWSLWKTGLAYDPDRVNPKRVLSER